MSCYGAEMDNKKIKALQSHIEQGDYFGTLATILDLLRQGLVKKELEREILKGLTDDLLYLQDHFKIVKRT